MSDTPKFTVIDRRKSKAKEEQESQQTAVSAPAETTPPAEPGAGPQLVVNEHRHEAAPTEKAETAEPDLPPMPTAQECKEQKTAYDASSQRLDDLLRAQNPAMGTQPVLGFEHLVQQFYISAMIQMGAGTQEGQHPKIDILGARNTIDLMAVLMEKTRGNLTEAEDRTLQSVLFELRLAFLELTRMISLQAMPQVPQPPPDKR